MKINTFEDIFELISAVRSHVDSSGDHIERYHGSMFNDGSSFSNWADKNYYKWVNQDLSQAWAIHQADILNHPSFNLKDRLEYFVAKTLVMDKPLFDLYLNAGDRVLNLLPFA